MNTTTQQRQNGQDTKTVIGVNKTSARRPMNPKTHSNSQRVWMMARPTLDRLWFRIDYAAYTARQADGSPYRALFWRV